MSEAIPREPTREDYRDGRNPFGDLPATRPVGALANAEQQKSISEVQARMIIARSNPRDPRQCMDRILQDCTRQSLAEKGIYQYARGGSSISGPSIRLAEAIAQRWGNIASGIKELSRTDGYSECVAYAWDLESGYYDERQYQVRHWRDTRGGGYKITDERDIYELIANMGQRRKRAVLLTVIPGDVVEAATDQCEETLRVTADTSPDALSRVVDAFEQFGVTKAQLEKRCQCRFEAVRPAQIIQLRKIYTSIKDGMSEPADWFEAINGAWAAVEVQHVANPPPTPAAKRGRPPKPAAPTKEEWDNEAATAAADAKRNAVPGDGIPDDRWEVERQAAWDSAQQPVVVATQPTLDIQDPTPAQPTTAATGTFEAWLVDGEGNEIPDADGVLEAFTDPVAFARAYMDALANEFPGTLDLFRKANHDSLIAAQIASTEVARILAGPKPADVSDAPKAVMGNGTGAAVDPALVLPPAKATPAEFTSYMDRLKVVLAMEATPDWINRVVDANEATYGAFPPARRLAAKALVEAAQKAISPAPAKGVVQTAEALANGIILDLESLNTIAEVDAWKTAPVVIAELDRLRNADAWLYESVAAAERMERGRIAAAAHGPEVAPDDLQAKTIAIIAQVNDCAAKDQVVALGSVQNNVMLSATLARHAPSLWRTMRRAVQAKMATFGGAP